MSKPDFGAWDGLRDSLAEITMVEGADLGISAPRH